MPVNNWWDYLEVWELNYVKDIQREIKRMDAKREDLVSRRLAVVQRGLARAEAKSKNRARCAHV